MQAYYKGNAVSLGGGASSGWSTWNVTDDTAPSAADMSALKGYTSDQLMTNVYDALMEAWPTYITKSTIGKDATNTYNIYQYIFCPDYPEQTIYIQSGVHGGEYDGWIGLANLMKLICNHWQEHEWLAYLRWKCRIIVVPIVNVWSVSTNHTRKNYNNVDLNRDLNSETPQAETVAMKANFAALMQAYDISFCIDYHTTTDPSWGGDAAIGDSPTSINAPVTALVAKAIAKKYAHQRLSSYVTAHELEADELYLPFWFNTGNPGTYSGYFRSFGLVSVTLEFADDIYIANRGVELTGRISLDLITNHVIALAQHKYVVTEVTSVT